MSGLWQTLSLASFDGAVWIATTVVAIGFIGGVAAAVLGGPVTDLGRGAGGLYPVPSPVLGQTAVAIGIPASVIVAGRLRSETRWLRAAAIAGGGLWVIAIGYFVIAHWSRGSLRSLW